MSKNAKKILYICVVAVIIILFLEVFMRSLYSIKYKDAGYFTWGFKKGLVLKNGYFKLSNFKEYYFDSTDPGEIHNGFRTKEFTLKKTRDKYRIIIAGGSSVYGSFFFSYKEAFPYFLEGRLNGDAEGDHFEVINAGIPGQTTYGVYNFLRNELLDMEPDMVIIYSLWNHFKIDNPALFKAGKAGNFLFQKAYEDLGGRSLLAYYLLTKIGTVSPLTTDKLDSYRIVLGNIASECQKRNVKLLIVKQLVTHSGVFASRPEKNLTDLIEGMSAETYNKALSVIDEIQEKYGVMILDFSNNLPYCKDRLDELLIDEVHLTRSGNLLLAELIQEALRK